MTSRSVGVSLSGDAGVGEEKQFPSPEDLLDEFSKLENRISVVSPVEENEKYLELVKLYETALERVFVILVAYLHQVSCAKSIVRSYERMYLRLKAALMERDGVAYVHSIITNLIKKVFHHPIRPLCIEIECRLRLRLQMDALEMETMEFDCISPASESSRSSTADEQRINNESKKNPFMLPSYCCFELPTLSLVSPGPKGIPLHLHNVLVESTKSLPPTMTFAAPCGILHFAFMNPFEIPEAPYAGNGMSCDACMGRDLACGYRAVFSEEETNDSTASGTTSPRLHTGEIVNGCVGCDLCVACATFFYARQLYRMELCLHPPYSSFSTESAAVKVLRTRFFPSRSSSERAQLRIRCALSPFGATPIAWTIGRKETRKEMRRPSDKRNDPPAGWELLVSSTPAYNSEADKVLGPKWGEELCTICMEALSLSPVLVSQCHHVFHASCIQDVLLTTSRCCPLCRRENTFPPISGSGVLKVNIFDVELAIATEGVGNDEEEYLVFVGALLRDHYLNCTNIGAATVIRI